MSRKSWNEFAYLQWCARTRDINRLVAAPELHGIVPADGRLRCGDGVAVGWLLHTADGALPRPDRGVLVVYSERTNLT